VVAILEEIEQISSKQLHKLIQKENDIFFVDVRNEDEFEEWQIESRYTPETINVPYFEFFENEQESLEKVPANRPIVVICAKGGASDFVAAMLEEEGIRAVNLSDVMIGWGNLYVNRPIVEKDAYQIYQVDRVARGCLSYVLISGGKAVIIDPLRHTEKYLQLIDEKGTEITLVLDTHGHADHISGGPTIAKLSGAPYFMHPYDGIHPFDMLPARLEYNMLCDGQIFEVGDLQIKVLHVPGHTLGQVNFLVSAGDGESYFFTGDNLFIQSFGRPDLGGQGQSWAPLVYETIYEKVKQLVPPTAWVLPGHYARHDEAQEDGIFATKLADLWETNKDLRFEGKEQFIEYVLNHLPEMPQQYVDIKRVNAGLLHPDEEEASELELGKNICALSSAY
jgi:glyoxylase-like metal-dependent hydrolase (beta-lactamase superfamily II)/rhodanese-related sulfurtransferase